ncbi:MAG: hypothetical protein V3T17_16455 [Pseudomonadales bacterium]
MNAHNTSITFTKAALLALFSIIAHNAIAQFQIVNSSTPGVYTISGASFGSSPGTVIHDDFETGAADQPLKNWEVSSNGGQDPVYASNVAVNGQMSGKSRFFGSNYNSTAEYKRLGSLQKVYLSYYVKVERVSGNATRNLKLARISAGYSGGYTQITGITLFDTNKSGILYNYHSPLQDQNQVWAGQEILDGYWTRVEYFLELSTPAGATNGNFWIKRNGKTSALFNNVITESTGKRMEWLTLPYFVAHDPGGDYNIYYDNVVLSSNQARVELCDKSDYASCKQPIIAKVVSWSDSQIIINPLSSTLNYYYVFLSDGSLMNQNGITVSAGSTVSPPLAPSNLTVSSL